ncbi:sugar dehydrogenase complex small subunit [Gluconobacter wancherniae]|uniref:sugar dehydrogenase complex small subunit n=1 Tax=Gluconobacter wancherniae TaxID=1307955 RepID=UPI0030B6CE64
MKSLIMSQVSLNKVSRRKLLLGGLAIGSLSAFSSLGVAASPVNSDFAGFLALSEFLTGKKDLSPILAQRYYLGLHTQFPDLPNKIATLLQEIHAFSAKSMDDYLRRGPTPAARSTATQIVSAWYLGIIGENPHKSLIAYSKALMFLPVAGALVIPSYGAGPLAWGGRPEPVMTFQGSPNEY